MTTRNFDAIFKPKAIVLIGASDKPGSVGAVIARNLTSAGFSGQILMVNPRRPVICGSPAYSCLADLPMPPDLAVIATPAATVPALIAELGALGCRAAIVLSAGFGGKDSDLRTAMLNAARPNLMRIIGPNCLGLQSPAQGINAGFAHLQPAAGRIALVSQSGAVLASLIDWAAGNGIGFSHLVSLGDMDDVDFGDMLDHLALDAGTDSILLYVENITHARKFMSAARIAARAKPVIVVKSGRSSAGAKAAATHTGALAGADLVYDAAFRRAGMLRVDELGHLFDAAQILARGMRVAGDRLTILTNGGGAGVMAVDALQAAGGRLSALSESTRGALNAVLPPTWSHANPIDIIGDASAERYRAALDILGDAEQDAILVMNCPTGVADSVASAQVVVEAQARHKTPLITCWLGEKTANAARRRFAEGRVATFETPERAVRAFMQLADYRRNQDLLLETPSVNASGPANRDAARRVIAEALRDGRRLLSAPEASAILVAYNIPTVDTAVVADPAAARAFAAQRQGPFALKILSPDITHKSDVGGVRLALPDAAAVEKAALEMIAAVRAKVPTARISGLTVQPMIERPGAVELIAGIHTDPTFGPVLLFGAGGVAVEVLADRAMALAPLNQILARDLIRRTRVSTLLAGYRDVRPADLAAIESVLIHLSDMIADLPEIAGLDINPLLADANGVIALDARIEVRERPADRELALVPYPTALQRTIASADGKTFILRAIRPEDETKLVEMARLSSPDDVRARFLGQIKQLSHDVAARLSQIDYDREMALVAIEGEERDGALIGVAHLLFDPNFEQSEFAIMVRTDHKGKGLGSALMRALLNYAADRGARAVSGYVSADNAPMLQLARDFGAVITLSGQALAKVHFDINATKIS